ncbi:hypothetical protein B0A67_03350 [Flavobacterium aquidurense]|uniref:hypothetical protein n=1 Tax=Flavobacterium aquidurense TaxID=362413 RepID=UPI0009154BE9|nr:hypothetical protein [Flavobacterium aquidurense]OXA73724.1 hypothetical protein B0A67_03350 [Flavobacterium aquidurense]SHG78784.1 hypothetical protein SAMN05444481_107164 [Flavobacterium frigidimaris]
MQTIQTVRNIRRKHKPIARCRGDKKEQEQFRSNRTITDGFLRHSFLPLFEQSENLPEPEQTQKGFFDSLAILTRLYGFETIDIVHKSYPYNILLAYADIQKQFRRSERDIELKILQDDDGTVKLATNHTYNTGNTLYYIPVLPLYRLLQNKKQKQSAELLLSVFAYLYHIAGIPYYRENNSYLFYSYECMEEWLIDDLENEESQEDNSIISEFNRAIYYGDIMLRKIFNPYHLNCFQSRVDNYRPRNSFEKDCLSVAKIALELLREYPNDTIFSNTSNQEFDSEEGIIKAEQYISFIADSDGLLYDNIARIINDEFNECSEIEEPTVLQIYDTENELSNKVLDFEYKLFALLNDLCTLLNNMP